jgi:hypothetical protein
VNVLYSLNEFLIPLGKPIKKNTYHQFAAKNSLMDIVKEQSKDFTTVTEYPVNIELHIYRDSDRRMDVGNVSVIEKFTTDALVQQGILIDDSWKYINSITMVMAGLDKENPRVEYIIQEKQNVEAPV